MDKTLPSLTQRNELPHLSRCELPRPVSDGQFAQKFCRNCEAGWTRQLELTSGVSTTIKCKLDMEVVNPKLFFCDNFEQKTLSKID